MEERPPKRRRVDSDSDAAPSCVLEREPRQARSSLQSLYDDIGTYSDVLVVAGGRDFPCIGAVLAAASRPLAAMLFGPATRMVTPSSGDAKPRLVLQGTEPWTFECLLRYLHGRPVDLDVDHALALYHVADYFDVLPLQDDCSRFLLNAVCPANCCSLITRSQSVFNDRGWNAPASSHLLRCDTLEARCVAFLIFGGLADVASSDPAFATLDPATLERVLSSDSLVCADEIDVLEALCCWYDPPACNCLPDADRLAWLVRLLQHVRWHLIPWSAHAAVIDRVSQLRAPAAAGEGGPHRQPGQAEDATRPELLALVQSLLQATPSGQVARTTRSRHWGRLTAQWPVGAPLTNATPAIADATDAVSGDGADVTAPTMHSEDVPLSCTHEYTVGRSRRCRIRVGHDSPQPYISSQHFRIFCTVKWPSASAPLPGEEPYLQPWIEDTSQNGTYLDGKLIERGNTRPLHDGAKIEMVFSHPRSAATGPSYLAFPHFYYHRCPELDSCPESQGQ